MSAHFLSSAIVLPIGIVMHLLFFMISPWPKTSMPDQIKNLVIGAVIVIAHILYYQKTEISWMLAADASLNIGLKYLLVLVFWKYSHFKTVENRYFATLSFTVFLCLAPPPIF